MTAKSHRPLLVNLTWAVIALVGLCVLYVLSYAPVVRFTGGSEEPDPWHPFAGLVPPRPADSERFPIYAPIDWMIDHTPLARPLWWWAGLWGVRGDFEYAAVVREDDRKWEAELLAP